MIKLRGFLHYGKILKIFIGGPKYTILNESLNQVDTFFKNLEKNQMDVLWSFLKK